MQLKITCELCGYQDDSWTEILYHLSLMHPEDWDGLQRWPDGTLVVLDDTLEPDDFA